MDQPQLGHVYSEIKVCLRATDDAEFPWACIAYRDGRKIGMAVGETASQAFRRLQERIEAHMAEAGREAHGD